MQQTPPVPAEDCLVPLSTFGIGSVPFTGDLHVCEILFERWDIPFWPQYPTRSHRENFIFQFLNSIPGFSFPNKNGPRFDGEKYRRQEKAHRDRVDQSFLKGEFLSFEPGAEWALGYSEMKALLAKGSFPGKRVIKLQVTGPQTVWKSFFSTRVPEVTAQKVQKDLSRTLTAVGLAQIERIRLFGRFPFIVIDEPLFEPRNLSLLRETIVSFKNFGALVGLHVCSNQEWVGLENLEFDVLHFDLTTCPSLRPQSRFFLRTWLKKGNWIAWGIVPTLPSLDFRARDFSSILLRRLQGISNAALPIERILRHSLIAPACGTGVLHVSQDEAVWGSILLTSQGLRKIPVQGGGK